MKSFTAAQTSENAFIFIMSAPKSLRTSLRHQSFRRNFSEFPISPSDLSCRHFAGLAILTIKIIIIIIFHIYFQPEKLSEVMICKVSLVKIHFWKAFRWCQCLGEGEKVDLTPSVFPWWNSLNLPSELFRGVGEEGCLHPSTPALALNFPLCMAVSVTTGSVLSFRLFNHFLKNQTQLPFKLTDRFKI